MTTKRLKVKNPFTKPSMVSDSTTPIQQFNPYKGELDLQLEQILNPPVSAKQTGQSQFAPAIDKNAILLNYANKARDKAIKEGEVSYTNPITNQRTNVNIEPEIPDKLPAGIQFLSELLGGGAGMFKTSEAYSRQEYLEQESEKGRRQQFSQSPNDMIRFANTPVIGDLTPADITGIALIGAGAIEGARTIYNSYIRFSQLPQYKAMQQFAKTRGISKESTEYQNMYNTLKSAYNLYQRGATDAANRIMSEFQQSYLKAIGNQVPFTGQGGVPATNSFLTGAKVPMGTQSGAMEFGGQNFQQKIVPIVDKITNGIKLTTQEVSLYSQNLANKIVNKEQWNIVDRQFYANNAAEVESTLKEMTLKTEQPLSPNEQPKANITPEISSQLKRLGYDDAYIKDLDQAEVNSIIKNQTKWQFGTMPPSTSVQTGQTMPEPLPEVTESTTKPVTEPESVIVDEEINPVARRVEIEAMLSQPAKGLPMTKIALRAELEKINNQLVPEEKKLRKNIMAVVKSKALSKTEYQDIFKKNGGSRYLTNVNLPELDKVLKSIKNARPHKIGNKTVITKNTENLIQTTRQNLEESGKLKDGDYNSILRMLGYKTDKYIDSNNFITNKEGLNIIHAMKRKSLMGFAVVEERINDIVKELGAPSQIVPPITKASFDVSWGKKYGDKLNSIFVRTARVERILDRIDGKDNGLLIRTFYNPVNQATSKKISGKSIVMEDFRKLLKDNNIDIGKLMNSKVKIDNVELTSSEKIGIYLSNLNKDNLRHLKEGNGFSDKLIEDVTNSLTESEKKIAEWLQEYFKDGYDSINEAKLYVTGEELGKTENYFPIRIESRANPSYKYWEQVAKTDSLSFITEWASGGIEKGFTKERTGEAVQAVNLDSMFIFLNHLEAVEHYKAFAPVIADLQLIMKSDKFKNSFINKAGYNTYQVLDKWLKQVADINPLEPTNHAESVMRTLRVNAATAALGLNITTAMKQPISFSNGAAEIGLINSFKGMFTYLQNPNKTRDFIKEFSPQIYNRSFEREIAEEKQMRKPGSVFSGKLTPREVFMILSTTMDKITVSSIWIGAFEKSLNSNINDLSEAAYYADSVIRKTQPFFDIKDLPEYYRSGEFMKTITQFTNQLNNNWNYYVYDIYGKAKAGRISKLEALRRILLAFIVPSLIIGAITRARLPKDLKEAAFDLASQGLSSLPIIGTFITSGMNGFTGGGLITTEIFSEISEITNKITNGKFDTLWKNILPFAGYATGIPVSQPKRIIETIIDIAQGKFDDWRELIWSKYSIDKYNKKDIDSIFEVPKDKNSKKTSPFDNSSKTPFNRRVKNPFK